MDAETKELLKKIEKHLKNLVAIKLTEQRANQGAFNKLEGNLNKPDYEPLADFIKNF